MSISVAIKEFIENKRDAKSLLKLFMSNRWIVPIPDEETGKIISEGTYPDFYTIRDDAGKLFMDIFSDEFTFETYKTKYPEVCDFTLVVDGWWLFQVFKTMDDLDYVNIDTESDTAIKYQKEEFEELAEYAVSFEVAEILRRVRYQGDWSRLSKIKNYTSYHLLIDKEHSSEEAFIVLAPDKKNRRLAAVFTSYSLAEQAMNLLPKTNELDRSIIKYDGETLFKNTEALQTDGIVFNVATELEPIAFQAQFAEIVLNS